MITKKLKTIFSKKTNNLFSEEITQRLDVFTEHSNDELFIKCGDDKFIFNIKGGDFEKNDFHDFAVWVCLPIAMAKKLDIYIHGIGSIETKKNAERLSDIWSSWLPKKYSLINVEFEKYRELKDSTTQRPLMCFSGGVDSSYSLINYDFNGVKPNLLTLQGMDYSIQDDEKFNKSTEKSNYLVEDLINKRFFVSSNAYDVYRQYKIKTSQSYIFLLATVAGYFSRDHSCWILAADHAWYQQFEAFPYGSTFATNRHFHQGDYKLITHGEDVTRAEKLSSITNNMKALRTISFCKDKSVRPENCGKCPKCIRTKYMFLASIGRIPEEIFLDPTNPEKFELKFSNDKNFNASYIKDTYKTAFREEHLELVPSIVKQYKKLI